MGKTAFSGPVYGAKGLLMSAGPFATAGGTTSAFASIVVPAYETWYVTETFASNAQLTSNSSNVKIFLKAKGTSTSVSYPGPGPDPAFPTGNPGTILSLTGPTSTAAINLSAAPTTPTPGEYEGYGVPANSSLRIVSSGTIGALFVNVRGFVRFLSSTRAE